MMKSFFSFVVITFLSLLSTAGARPANSTRYDSSINTQIVLQSQEFLSDDSDTISTFIPKAPHWVVYSDEGFSNGRPPTSAQLKGFNVFILSFFLVSGPADTAYDFTQLDDDTRDAMISDYHDHGISILISAFGSTEAPTSNGVDPVDMANTVADFVKQYGLDGVDVDYEDFDAIDSGSGSAEKWMISFTKQLRSQLPAGRYIITHAPVAPWFTTDTDQYPHGAYRAVNSKVGKAIDWYNVQFYNQGSDYNDCDSLLTESQSDFAHTSIFEINEYSHVPLSKLVIGKPGSPGDADSGYMSPSTLAGCLATAKDNGWNGGAMFWEYPRASSSFIRKVRAESWPV